jgi:hypothetical protein
VAQGSPAKALGEWWSITITKPELFAAYFVHDATPALATSETVPLVCWPHLIT